MGHTKYDDHSIPEELLEWYKSCILNCLEGVQNFLHFADAMEIAEDCSQIPLEWVDAEEWAAIEQAFAAATTSHFPLNDTTTSVDCLTRNEHSTESLKEEEKIGDEHLKGVRRTLPAWGQKIQVKEIVIPTEAPLLESEVDDGVKPVVVQTNLRQLTDSWEIARNANTKAKVQSRCLYLQFKGRLVYSKTYNKVDEAAHAIWEMIGAKRESSPGNVAVGFDLEWKTSFQRGEASGKVAVVQLCLDSGRCDVMHIVHSGIPPSLVTILEDPSILKTGVGSHGDASKLQRDYGIQTRGVMDLSEIARQKLDRGWQSWSLSSLAEALTCKKVEKVSSIRCGDWEACPLSPQQLQYAATDAFASLYLYQILETFSIRELKKEESRSDLPLIQQGP